jgi:hypothetical protein
MSSEDLKKIFDESIGSTKAYVNTKVKGINLKITAESRTFQIDIMFYKIGQSLKPFLLLVDIMSRKTFCHSIPGEKNMTKIITKYNKFLQEVDYVKAVEGDGEFDNTAFKKLNEEKDIEVYTSVAKDNHFTVGNKLGIIDRLTRTLKENIRKYRSSAGTKLGNLQSMMHTVVKFYNDSPHRGISGKTPNQMWDNIKDQETCNIVETMSNDKIFNKLPLAIGDDVRVLDRIGYSYKVKDEGSVK